MHNKLVFSKQQSDNASCFFKQLLGELEVIWMHLRNMTAETLG